MKIMFYTSSLGKGGAERVISNLSNYLINEHDVSIMVNTKKISYEIDERVNIIQLDDEKIRNSIKRNLKRIEKTKSICNKEKFDVIISFLPVPSFRILYLKNKIKSKIIVSDRNNPKVEYKNLFIKLMMKILYKRADGFVFQTEEQKSFFSKKIQNKSVVIPNSLKEEFLKCEEYERKNIIINVGRLVGQKNQELLIKAFKKISMKHNNYILKIFGEGILRDKLYELIDELNLKDQIFLCGTTNNIKDEFSKAKIFILSSNYEGMPNALLEAMSCGLACISTDCPCGGPKELIINKENGILVPVNDEEKLVEAINELIEDEKFITKLGIEASKISKKLNPKVINKKWNDYIYGVFNK